MFPSVIDYRCLEIASTLQDRNIRWSASKNFSFLRRETSFFDHCDGILRLTYMSGSITISIVPTEEYYVGAVKD